MLPSPLIARILSRLLSHDAAARRLLAAHAGHSLQLNIPPLSARLRVTEDGVFEAAPADLPDEAFTVRVAFPLSALPVMAQGKEAAIRAAKVSGHGALLQDISKAFQSLPLAAEAELEQHVGPLMTQQILRVLTALKSFGENASDSLHTASKRYLQQEAKLVVTREQVAQFAADIQRLRIDLQRLQTRTQKLG